MAEVICCPVTDWAHSGITYVNMVEAERLIQEAHQVT
jgi:hypothetical protein